jgi:DNA mismatch endonuclease (patch repair protein)
VPLSRSQQMARIRGVDTGPERRLRRALWRRGLRYRIAVRHEFGRPDLTFSRQRVVVFIDGCFWHGCPKHYVRPQTRPEFWAAKLAENVRRDQAQTTRAENAGWHVARIWEHEVDHDLDALVGLLHHILEGRDRCVAGEHWQVVRAEAVPDSQYERRRLEELRGRGRPKAVLYDAGRRRGPEGARSDSSAYPAQVYRS